ncbi:MAG: hypothetical protein ACXABV_13160 [Candidatus Thorarchaeota archaeon]|jgi:anaerobic ribonucleoside-triphosphate reductase
MTDIHSSVVSYEDLKVREKKLPKVRTTSSTLEPFDVDRIIESLIVEAKLSRPDAQLVGLKVMDRIAASGIKFLSGPLIREMCNSILAELGFEKERILYTRVGVPMYDLNQLIHNPGHHTNNANLMRNPETIAKLVHDQVMEQHTFLSDLEACTHLLQVQHNTCKSQSIIQLYGLPPHRALLRAARGISTTTHF